jgi:predicted DNA-binding mobile mystery protein A
MVIYRLPYNLPMKQNRKSLHLQRRALDQKLKLLSTLSHIQKPRLGWIKAIRESILMTTRQLGNRMKISHVTVTEMEKREASKAITLETLERAANALNCKLVYALVPKEGSLDSTLKHQAFQAATSVSRSAIHSMGLEDQSVSAEETKAQIQEQAQDLIQKADSRIWGTPNSKIKKKQP